MEFEGNHVSNEELFKRTKVDNLHDTVHKRQKQFVGTSYVFRQQDQSVQQYSGRQKVGKGDEAGRPKKTWQDTLRSTQ